MEIDLERLAGLCERNDIGRLRLFGSVARGDACETSDVDLIVDFTRRKSLLDLVRTAPCCSKLLAATVFVCASASDLPGQSADSVDGRLLPIQSDTFSVLYGDNTIGRSTMEIVQPDSGRLLQIYEWRSASGDVIVDSLLTDLVSLRPIREVRVAAGTREEVTFQRESIVLATRGREGAVQHATVPNRPGAYSSASLGALAAASPLAEGYERMLLLYYAPPSEHGFVPVRLRVQGDEIVPGTGGSDREAWVVNASTPGGDTTYWIDKGLRSVLRFTTREGGATIEFRR